MPFLLRSREMFWVSRGGWVPPPPAIRRAARGARTPAVPGWAGGRRHSGSRGRAPLLPGHGRERRAGGGGRTDAEDRHRQGGGRGVYK